MGFNHSIKVPTQYKRAAAVFKKAIEEKISAKSLGFQERHAKIPNLLALLTKYSDNRDKIERIITDSKILEDNPRLDKYLCRVLVTELLFGTKHLKSDAKPVICVSGYKDTFEKLLGGELERKSNIKVEKPRYVRINTALISVSEIFEILEAEEWKKINVTFDTYDGYTQAIKAMAEDEYLVDFHIPQLLVFHPKWKSYWACHDLVSQKKLFLQDKATCLVGTLLNPPPQSVVLDMCAAPGMKTIHLSNIMENTGTIYAVEQNVHRYQVLCEMVKLSEATCVQTLRADSLTLGDKDVPGAEYILVDPSCSGSGIQNRISLSSSDDASKHRLRKLSGFQIKLLTHAMTAFPNIKRIAYSTCSIHEEENEQVVQRCLQLCPEFKLLNAKKSLGKKWKNVASAKYPGIGKKCIYSLPDDDLTDGIFIAIFEKIKGQEP